MAKNHNLVLLGYQDEAISEKYSEQVDFKVNKIGGDPVSFLFRLVLWLLLIFKLVTLKMLKS